MPQQRKNTTALPTRKLISRRVRAAGVAYPVRTVGPDGRVVEVIRDAKMGDEITADPFTIMTLDSGGSLAPPGASREDVERELQERIEEYRSQRRGVGGII